MATKVIEKHGPSGWIFFMAYVGAFLYFMHGAYGFGGFVSSLLKACVWPAYLVYHVFTTLGV